jgi:hypothetical protein
VDDLEDDDLVDLVHTVAPDGFLVTEPPTNVTE